MLKRLDGTLIILTLLIFAAGMLLQYSVSYQSNAAFLEKPTGRQLLWFFVSLVFVFIILRAGYHRLIMLAYPLYAALILSLIILLIIGKERSGAVRWLQIGGFNFQPSEFIKLALMLALSYYLGQKGNEVLRFKNFIMPFFLTALPAALIMKQPDLGTALVLFPILISILFVAGARMRYVAGFFAISLLSAPFFWGMLKGYQKQRLLVFINPDSDPLGAGYTIIQSRIAVGSGGFFGKGWLSGTQNQLNFLPVRHTDFIFSAGAEEWGFAGSILLLALYFLLIRRILLIARTAENSYGRSLAAGVAAMLAFQTAVNIAMTIGFVPVVGMTLPLVSYGGSSLMVTLMGIALALSVGEKN